MDKKYTPHIRIPFSLFDSSEYKQIPDTLKPYCLSVLVCLLKFVNTKSGRCYPRRSTISSMTGLSRTTVWKATNELKKANIIQIKRLSSTLLYIIEPRFIFGDVRIKNSDVRLANTDVRNTNILIKLSSITNINRTIERISKEGGSKEKIVNELSTLPTDELEKAIKENNNPYFCRLALELKSRKVGKLVNLPSQKQIMEQLRKKTNFAYQRAIEKRKRDDGRQNRSKDLLRSDFKAKR